MDLSGPGTHPVVTKFIDGVKVGEQTDGLSSTDGRFSLYPQMALLFAENNGYNNDAYVSSVQFSNGRRPLVRYPQKRLLIRLTTRPPQLETPFSVFNEGVITPNDAFFVRYHLTNSPPPESVLRPETFRVEIKGSVKSPLSLSVEELRRFEAVEVVAVNQCSGNSRAFFEPRVSAVSAQ